MTTCLVLLSAAQGRAEGATTVQAEGMTNAGMGNGGIAAPGDLQRVGEIVSLRQPVIIRRGGRIGEAPGTEAYAVETLQNGDWIYDGDWIEVGAQGHVEFVIGNQGRLRLGAHTQFQLVSERMAADGARMGGRMIHGYLRQGVVRARVRRNVVTPLQVRFHARLASLTLSRGDLILRGGARRMEVCVRSGEAEFQYGIEDEGGSAGIARGTLIRAQHQMTARLPVQREAIPEALAVDGGCPRKSELEFTVDQREELDAVPIRRRPDLDGA